MLPDLNPDSSEQELDAALDAKFIPMLKELLGAPTHSNAFFNRYHGSNSSCLFSVVETLIGPEYYLEAGGITVFHSSSPFDFYCALEALQYAKN